MIATIDYRSDTASAQQVAAHFTRCDAAFLTLLRQRVEIGDYANKIVNKARRLEAWSDSGMIGLVAVYCNDHENHVAHITSVTVEYEWTRKGIASNLIRRCVALANSCGMRKLSIEVADSNTAAISLYGKFGFVRGAVNGQFISMALKLDCA